MDKGGGFVEHWSKCDDRPFVTLKLHIIRVNVKKYLIATSKHLSSRNQFIVDNGCDDGRMNVLTQISRLALTSSYLTLLIKMRNNLKKKRQKCSAILYLILFPAKRILTSFFLTVLRH